MCVFSSFAATFTLDNINPILIETLRSKLKCNEDTQDAKEILEGMQAFLPMILEEAINRRTIKLSDLQKERVNNELILVNDQLTPVLQNVVLENKHVVETVEMLLAASKENITNPEIKLSLSYPVVKEVLVTVLQNGDTHDMKSADIIISALVSWGSIVCKRELLLYHLYHQLIMIFLHLYLLLGTIFERSTV